ncbi:MAG TPA: LysM peptidoglycan-binding domain-containing protein [Flavisolibacter sp.]
MKKSFFLAILLSACTLVFGQNLILHNDANGLYLSHTVVAKENFYSIGRLYNITANEIAASNRLDMSRGLNVGQVLRIPLTPSNFSQTAEDGKPVYYVVEAKEGLYRVSVKNNNVLMANLRKWNHLATDNISAGQKLIVGFIVSGETAVAQAPATAPKKEDPQPMKPEPVKEEIKTQPAETEVVQKKEEVKKVPPVKQAANVTVPPGNDANGGFFRSQFEKQVKMHPVSTDNTVSAGIFKTASGWQDAKYYALIDNVEPGTILRITNLTNNKVVYAKVLGAMSGIRQNQGYDLRISNAAASALEVNDTDKFIVRVNY